MSVVVIATIVPLEGQRDAVVSALEEAIAKAHAEDEGCELYALHEADDRLVMVEKWASGAALASHGKGEALRQLGQALKDKTAGPPDVVVLRPHPAGSAEQGTL